MNIYLVGYRGVGKTTVAARLAAKLAWQWIDADDEIERRAGKTIAQIFADDGEPAFRDLESEVVADLARRDRLIVALGGGAVLRAENRRALSGGKIIWLTADAATLHARLNRDQTTAARRPNLTSAGGLGEIEELLAQREPIYRACADLVVDASVVSPQVLADQIAAKLSV